MKKYLADFSKKELKGPVTMEKPADMYYATADNKPLPQNTDFLHKKYAEHLASLPIAFTNVEWLKESDDGQVLELGKNFEVKRGNAKMTIPDQQQWQEMSVSEKDDYFERVAVKIEPADEIEDELRMIISHAFLGEDQNISKQSFDLAISECAKYFRKSIPVHINQDKQQEEDKKDFEILAEYDQKERLAKTIHHCLTKMPEENREQFIINLCNGMIGSAVLHYRNRHELKMNIKPFNEQFK